MNFLFLLLVAILASLLPVVRTYTSAVSVENLVINSQTAYTFTFGAFPDNTARSIVLTFPSSSDISSGELEIFVNNNLNPIPQTSYVVESALSRITINDQIPVSNSLVFRITKITNPPSAEQFTFISTITPPDSLVGSFPYANYVRGNLQSCEWKFDKFTGSTNSMVDIDIVLGNRLLSGTSIIQIRFPNLYEDSDSKYLTLTPPTISYSINGGINFLNPLASPTPTSTSTRIGFSISLPSGLAASSLLRIRLSGIVNPPTETPSGRNFIVSTFDSSNRGIDRIAQCTIHPLNVLQLVGTFDMTSLRVNDPYPTPKITVNSIIPFIITQYDILQLDHNEAWTVTTSTPLEISLTRGSAFFVSFNVDNTQPTTATTKYFRGNMENSNQASATTQIQFKFNIRAPFSQKPWEFVIWLKKNSGSYVKIRAQLQAYAIAVNPSKVQISAGSTQMAIQSQYTLKIELERAISKNGMIWLGFHPDYDIVAGACVGYNELIQITSSPTCDVVVKNGFKWLVYKIGQTSTETVDLGTNLTIHFTAPSIRNPLFPNTYTYRLEAYYTQMDDSLVQRAQIFGSITMTRHFSLKAQLLNNDFTVYEAATLTISYSNEVYIPTNSILEFILPVEIISFDFIGKITINSIDVTNATLDKNFPGGKIGQITIKQNIDPGTSWEIPLTIKMPIICGDYPTITLRVMRSGVIYEQVNSGLQIRVRFPSVQLSTVIEPHTNNEIDAATDYLIRVQSRVPLSNSFFVIVTLPAEVRLSSASSCLSNRGTCAHILNPSPNVLNLTLINSPYLSSQTSQDFDFIVSTFINPRSQGLTSSWTVQIKGLFNGMVRDISMGSAISSNYMYSRGASCQFDQTKNYFRSNTEPVVLRCIFVNNLIAGDYVQISITSNAYRLNPGILFSCTSPVLSHISCINSFSSSTTIIIKITIITAFVFNRNQFSLQMSGLISNPDTTLATPAVPLQVRRFDLNMRPIDSGIFYYDISCKQNQTIKSKTCKTCANGDCTACYDSMYLSNLGTCVRDCPSQTQFRGLNNPDDLICQPCTPPCFTCENTSLTCLSCISQSFFLYRTSHTCQSTCDTSQLNWVNTEIPGQRICDQCLAECKRCANNTLTGCLQCHSGYVLEEGACRASCRDPRSYIINGVCIVCNAACETCNGSGSSNCILCKQLYYMNNGFCVATCPSNKYPLPNETCGCQSNCASCTGSSPTFCASCLDPTMLIHNGSCLSSCPEYTFASSTQCIECTKNCLRCVNSVSCLQCGPGYFNYESLCYGDCNSISLQFDALGNTCVLCPSGCDRCNGNICTACLDGFGRRDDECVRECILTNTCSIQSPVPDSITPAPATIAFFVWVGIVYVAKWFNPKIYAPYSIIFLTSAIEYFLIIGATIYSSSLVQESNRRLLQIDLTQRPIIMSLLIVSLVVNYLMNIVFAIIFYKYLAPLVTAPRQVDYITIGVVFVIGMLTNYRFCLIFFSKMFPKPRIHVEFSSRLTPVHYLCIASVFLSGFALAACGIILKNQYPLTDIFMLGIDILIIEVILILFSVWMVAVDKDQQYYESETKKYHLEENYRTQENVLEDKDDKNTTKNHLQIRDQFNDQYHGNPLDDTNQKKLLGGQTTLISISNPNIPESDHQKPLDKRQNRFDLDKIRMANKVQNSFETDISDLNKLKKTKNNHKADLNASNNQTLKQKQIQNVVDFDKKGNFKAVFDSKKFQTSDQQNLPKAVEISHQNNILGQIHEPSSDDIPNLPMTNSVFHERSSSEFSHKIKPKRGMSKGQQKSQILKNKSPLKGRDIEYSQTQSKSSMMKKKNKFFESQKDFQIPQRDKGGSEEIDIQKIIKDKIVVIGSKEARDDKLSMGDAHNISSIQKKEQENSDFNDQVSPSWFNIQNQRFDVSSVTSDFSDNN